MDDFVSPNLYELSNPHHHVHVTFMRDFGGGPLPADGRPFVTYRDGSLNLQFKGQEVQIVQSDAGDLVSVTLQITTDTGSTSFSFLIPKVNLAGGTDRELVRTEAVTTTHKLSPIKSANQGQRDEYAVLSLSGTARVIKVPL